VLALIVTATLAMSIPAVNRRVRAALRAGP
jgi:hypothetical protein